MQKYTIIATDNNVNPVKQICVVEVDTDAQPPKEETIDVDYNAMSPEDQAQFDACVAMIETYAPPMP
jgi:hypothetical protein